MAVRILIADDSAAIRRALRVFIEQNPQWRVCGEAVDGDQAIAKTIELKPDLIVLDFAMPGLNGIQAAREISRGMPNVPIMLYTMYLTPQLVDEARAAGFGAAVPKDVTGHLMAGIRALLRRETFFPQPGSLS